MFIKQKVIIGKVSTPELINGTDIQELEIIVPRFDPLSGDKISEEIFPVAVFNDRIKSFKQLLVEGNKIQCDLYINAREVLKEGVTKRFINITLGSATKI